MFFRNDRAAGSGLGLAFEEKPGKMLLGVEWAARNVRWCVMAHAGIAGAAPAMCLPGLLRVYPESCVRVRWYDLFGK